METSVKVFLGKQGLAEIREEWLSLAREIGCHYLHYPFWYEARMQEYCDEQVAFTCIYSNKVLQAVLPLQRASVKMCGIKVPFLQLYYPNEMGVSDILSRIPLGRSRRRIVKAASEKLGVCLFLKLHQMAESSMTMQQNLAFESSFIKKSHHSNYLDFSDGYEQFMAARSSKFRSSIRSKTKKAQAGGEVEFTCVTCPDELQDALDIFVAVEDASWKGQEGTSLAKQPEALRYYRNLVKNYGGEGLCCIDLLSVGGKPVAALVGLLGGDTLYLLKIGYDADLSKLSPGMLLIDQAMQRSSEEGSCKKISFITGMSWQNIWRPDYDNVYLSVGGEFGVGRLVAGALKLRERLRESKKQPRE